MTYNGHKNRNHWNVSLWLNSDDDLYDKLWHFVACAPTLDAAAHNLTEYLIEYRGGQTPDGAPYTFTTVRAAMVGMKARGY